MAPVYFALQQHKDVATTKICVTAQHRDMLDQVLDFFEIKPDYDLNLMQPNQNLYHLTANILTGLKPVLEDFAPDIVLVHGDTTTAMAASLATYYHGCKLAHIEAGLRTHNKHAPYPEEINRVITACVADIHFAPTEHAKNNLLQENIPSNQILVTGNTVIDALLYSVEKVRNSNNKEIEQLKQIIAPGKRLILLTMHRRENHGSHIQDICNAMTTIAQEPNVQIVYPVHRNPNVFNPVHQLLDNTENITLVDPLSYPSFVWLMDKADLIITDSGGIQEEAPSLGKPVLVLREVTERPEAIEAGTAILVHSDTTAIVEETLSLLNDTERYRKMQGISNPYGSGNAAITIAKYLVQQKHT